MRLEKIKLAGFKSFVDPTTVHFPGNLVGVVGPNGCGKSNIIDAVRWVMGESSAKMLRGESMADVIFNGSSSRKPVGSAKIELLFDNNDGSASGQYAQYSQISVKRQVYRDGHSSYFINGVRCRRRDITDLFLGTGLGPRSYSIIEQGMISRLIEARPEELRSFLEEAAGMSKYKERRRETESRIAHTRENLDRLNDLRDEIKKQLKHLQRQAGTAKKYRELKERERRLKAELLVLRWCSLDEDLKRRDKIIAEQETVLEAAIAKQRRLEAEIEADRERHIEANDRFNEVQGRFYAAGSEITKLEQAIQFARDARRQQRQDLEQTEQAWQESTDHQQQDMERLEELNTILAEEEPSLKEARAVEETSGEQLLKAEQAMQSWQTEWEEFNRQAAEPAQTSQVERTRINHLEQQDQTYRHHLKRLSEEAEHLANPRLLEEIAELKAGEEEQEQQTEGLQEELSRMVTGIRDIRESNIAMNGELNDLRAELQTTRGRYASLEALQEAALGKKGDGVVDWLERQDLAKVARLAEQIEVQLGWQRAVETVLGFHLQAVCVDGLDGLAGTLTGLENGSLALFDTRTHSESAPATGDRLLARVKAPWSLNSLMLGVRVAEGLSEALAMRPSLKDGESLITRDGIWLGRDWLRLNRESEETSGVLQREQEIRQLGGEIAILKEQIEALELRLEEGREKQRQSEHSREQIQQRLDELNRGLSDLRSNLSGRQARAEQLQNRNENVRREMEELRSQREEAREGLETTQTRLHAALEEMEALGARRETLVAHRDKLRTRLTGVREEAAHLRSRTHEMALRVESMRSSQHSLAQNLERMKQQLSHLTGRRAELKSGLEQSEEPIFRQDDELERQLKKRIEVESEMATARSLLEEIEGSLRQREQGRQKAEQKVEHERTVLEGGKMQGQEVLVHCKTLEEQLNETGFQRDPLFLELPEDASEGKWDEAVAKMDARIGRLGPINLAAIDEFQEQSERMQYLDAQHTDVTEALETLENAIRKIDRETRTRFKETFDKVNTGLQVKFPKLFGGGHAYLELTGEDLLDTGVTVMARPPGKRNSTIHLLSGGEKALTAVALVFAIFELNPAPFCMLDEVDAPLDDANVGRFCELVKSMSDRVQFILITHNKITMEISSHLTGVTMHEPGVSRLVSVDMEEAALMVAS